MKLRRKFITITLLISISSLLITACEPQESVPTIIHTETKVKPTTAPSKTSEPTATFLPTVMHTPTPGLTKTPTLSLTPAKDYSGVEFFTAGLLKKWRFFIAIKFPEKIEGEFYCLVDKNKEYTCTILEEYPDRLYCTGPLAGIDDWIEYAIYESGSNQLVYEDEVFIPFILP